MAALGLITSAAAQVVSNPITISALPYTITAPGTYILASNLSFTVAAGTTSATPAIKIATNILGQVVLDFRGHTITSNGNGSVGVGIGVFVTRGVANVHPITVGNGTLQNFSFGVWAESGSTTVFLSNITVHDMTINILEQSKLLNAGIFYDIVNNSIVRNCTITHSNVGIEDDLSAGGNKYLNITFHSVGETLSCAGDQNGINAVLEACEYAPAQLAAPK